MINLQELLPYYPPALHQHAKWILREYLQCKILVELYRHPLWQKLCFIGWTCLRLIYKSKRFSEDLDFHNHWLTETEFETLTNHVQKTLELEGYTVEIRHVYKWAFHCVIRIPALLHANNLSWYTDEKILIKIDTVDQWVTYDRETHLLSEFDFQQPLLVTPKSVLVSMKLWACFDRVKGRDLYDLAFLWAQNIAPDRSVLDQKLWISDWVTCKARLLERIATRNLDQLHADVAPFLFDPNNQSVRYFRQIIEQTEFLS